MKNRIISFILALMLPCLLLTACGTADGDATTNSVTNAQPQSQTDASLRDTLNLSENKAFDQMTAYDYDKVVYQLYGVESGKSSTSPFLEYYHQKFPIERIEAIDSSHVCVAYKLLTDSGETVFTYIVFMQVESSTSKEENSEIWVDSLERYFVSHSLCLDDFSSIQPGDEYDKIAAIEPSLNFYTVDDPERIAAALLLTDGVLEVEFQRTENNTLVKSMQFYPWGAKDAPEAYQILKATAGSVELPAAD